MLDIESDLAHPGRSRGRAPARNRVGQKQELEFGYFAKGDQVSAEQQRLQAGNGFPYATERPRLEAKRRHRHLRRREPAGHAVAQLARRCPIGCLLHSTSDDLCAVQDVSRPLKTNPPGDASCLDQPTVRPSSRTDQRSSTASTALLPRGPLAWVRSRTLLLASYGKGVRSIDPGYITQTSTRPSRASTRTRAASRSRQVGDFALVARSIFFSTHVRSRSHLNESAGRNLLGAGTQREPHGWAPNAASPESFLRRGGNLTLVKVDVRRHPPARRLSARRRSFPLGHGPSSAILADHASDAKVRGTLSSASRSGATALPLGERSEDMLTIDASATLGWKYLELGLIATNLPQQPIRLGEYNFVSDFHKRATAHAGCRASLPRRARHAGSCNPRGHARRWNMKIVCFLPAALAADPPFLRRNDGGRTIHLHASASGPSDGRGATARVRE